MAFCSDSPRLPVIDLSLFDLGDPWREQVAAQIDAASGDFGFFCLVGHGVDFGVIEPLLAAGRRFFATEDAVRRRAQLGYHTRATQRDFVIVEELAARSLDPKHVYFEAQLTAESGAAGPAMSGPGATFLPDVPGIREPVLDYMRSLTGLSHKLMAMVARGLRLPDSYFVDRYTGSPTTSFRFLNYPRVTTAKDPASSSADPGLLTLLKQDASGGLELKYRERWIDVPAMPNSFICNVGCALAHLTNGRYHATAQRFRNSAQTDRLSMSFCFEPTLNARLEPIAAAARAVSAPPSAIASDALLDSAGRKIA